jgi:hypothetical protein
MIINFNAVEKMKIIQNNDELKISIIQVHILPHI